jgi:hypothetical protein
MPAINQALEAFRLASRGLFNDYFRVTEQPYENNGWSLLERFCEVEDVLFQSLVAPACRGQLAPYGQPQTHVLVKLRAGAFAPIMLNREMDSGYWDHPVTEVTDEAGMKFIRFFDWDQLAVRDNRYVEVIIASWPSRPELEGKHGLLEAQYATYGEA